MVAAALLTVGVASTPPARAANLTWTNYDGSPVAGWNWNAGSSWSGGTAFPDAIGDTANLNVALNAAQTVKLNKVVRLGAFNIGDTNSLSGYTIQPGLQANVTNGVTPAGNLLMDGIGSTPVTISKYGTATDDIQAAVLFNDALTITSSAAGGTLILSGGVRSATSGLTTAGAGNITLTAPALYMPGSLTINNTGTSTVTIAAAAIYGGATTVNGGILKSTVSTGALPQRTALTVAAAGTFDISNTYVTIGSLAGAGIVKNSGGTGGIFLTIGRDDTSTSFTGLMVPTTAANLAITKVGAGILTLQSLASSTYTGATVINGGGIALNFNSIIPFSLTGAGTIVGTAVTTSAQNTLTAGQTTVGSTSVTVTSTAALSVGMGVSGTGIPVGASVVSKDSATTFTITAPATASGNGLTILAGGTAGLVVGTAISGANIVPGSTVASIGSGTSFTLSTAATGSATSTLTAIPTILASTGAPTLAGGNLLVVGKAGMAATQTLGAVTVGLGGGTIGVSGGDATGTRVLLGNMTMTATGGTLLVSAPTNTTVFSTQILLSGIIGSGRAVFTDGTNYDWLSSGASSLAGGYSQLSGLSSGSYTALTGSTLSATSTVNYSLTGSVTLGASLTPGTVKIIGSAGADALTFGSRTLTVNNGILFTGATNYSLGGVSPTGTITAGNTAGTYDIILQQYSTGVVTATAGFADNGLNPATLVKAGPGTLTLAGANSFTGAVTLAGGTLNFSSTTSGAVGSLGAGLNTTAINLGDGTTLNYTGTTATMASTLAGSHSFNLLGGNVNMSVTTSGQTLTIAGAISGAGGLTVIGPANFYNGLSSLKLSGTNTYRGPTVLKEGASFIVGNSYSSMGGQDNPLVMQGQSIIDLSGTSLYVGSLSGTQGTPVSLTNATTNSTSTVTVASTAGLVPGMVVSGSADIPANATIANIINATTFVLSSAAVGSHSGLTLSSLGIPTITSPSGTPTFRMGGDNTQYADHEHVDRQFQFRRGLCPDHERRWATVLRDLALADFQLRFFGGL
jgi:autotransporter-associated beta strand protein